MNTTIVYWSYLVKLLIIRHIYNRPENTIHSWFYNSNFCFLHMLAAALVEALSAVVLIVLFLLQKFGTSRVSFLFSPIMGAWTLSTPLVGIYSIIHHYPSIFKALSPRYMFRFFWRNGKSGWLLLGGTVLCITGRYLVHVLRFSTCSRSSYGLCCYMRIVK